MTRKPCVVLRVEVLESRLVPTGVGPAEPAEGVAASVKAVADDLPAAAVVTVDAAGNEVYSFSAAPVQARCTCPLCTGRMFQSVSREVVPPTAPLAPATTAGPTEAATAADRTGAPDAVVTPTALGTAVVAAALPVALTGLPVSPPPDQPPAPDRQPRFEVNREPGPAVISPAAVSPVKSEITPAGQGGDVPGWSDGPGSDLAG